MTSDPNPSPTTKTPSRNTGQAVARAIRAQPSPTLPLAMVTAARPEILSVKRIETSTPMSAPVK